MEAGLSKEEEALFNEMAKDEEAPPPAKEEAPKAEAKAEAPKAPEKAAAAEQDKAKKEDSVVPAAALKEARAENKELRKELDTLKATLADGDKKLQKFMESVQKKAEEQPGPKFEDDPAAHLKHENESLKKQLTEINAKLAKQDEANDGQAKLQQFATFVTNREKEFAKTEPNYFKAAEFVADIWRDEFRESGFSEEELPRMVFSKSLAITQQATQKQKDPAEAIWKIAKRYGFAAKPQEEPKKEDKPDGGSKLEQIKAGVEASKTAGGGSGPDDLSIASLAQMDDEQIDKLVADPKWWSSNIRGSRIH